MWRREGAHWGFPRVSVGCDFLKPVRFEDVLTIAVIVERVGSKSVGYKFEFFNQTGDAVAVGRLTTVLCREAGPGLLESVELPADIRAKLAEQAA